MNTVSTDLTRLATALGLYDADTGKGWRFAQWEDAIGLWIDGDHSVKVGTPDYAIWPDDGEIGRLEWDAGSRDEPPALDFYDLAHYDGSAYPQAVIGAIFADVADQTYKALLENDAHLAVA